MLLTEKDLQQILKTNKNIKPWLDALNNILPKYDINTPMRMAHFLSQTAHESSDYNNLEENLNYSAERLLQVFPRYFGAGKRSASEYARNPEKLANYVYMDVNRSARGALGNTKPGDGWLFRGRGIKQLTGRNNYAAFGESIGMTAEQAAAYVATQAGAVESACWFWDTRNLNRLADMPNVAAVTKVINGGDIGLADRQRRFNEALKILQSAKPATSSDIALSRGARGPRVMAAQKALKISVDGDYGPKTIAAVEAWQKATGYLPTGQLTEDQLIKLLKG